MDLSTTPVIPAPPGEVTNFNVGMTSIQHKFINVYAGTLAAATACLLARIWTRLRIVRGFWADDYAIIGAWLTGAGFFISCLEWMKYGFGDHLWNVSVVQLSKYAELATPVVTLYCWAPMLTKFSILLLYLRLNPKTWFRWCVWFLMFTIFVYTIATTIIVAAGCKPTDPSKTQCINDLALAQAVLNIASDFFVIVLPLPMCYELHIPRGQKVVLALILAAGSFVVVASIIRLTIIQKLPGETDTTWVEAAVCVWSGIEINVGIMCNCLIVLKPMLKEYGGKLLGSFFNSSSGNTYPLTGSRTGMGSTHRWKQDSYPLGSMDRDVGGIISTGHLDAKNGRISDDNILVTSSFTVTKLDPNDNKSEREREFDAESQEDIIKRVKKYKTSGI